MTLPRWTAYLALTVLALTLVCAIPRRERRPSPGGTAGGGAPEHPRLVVLGIDGLDPDILREVVELYPERMPNFRKLIEEGDGIHDLASSNPPQSPVAWSNFITGRNPGGHGVYDFIHRDPANYGVLGGSTKAVHSRTLPLPGRWQFPIDSGGDSNRSGKAFWTILGEHGVPADVWRMPINFPVEPGRGWSIPDMMTPALDSPYGEPSLYTTDPPLSSFADADSKVIAVTARGGVAYTELRGPNNSFVEGTPRENLPFTIYLDAEAGAAVIEISDRTLVLEPGEWSDFVPVEFEMLPAGLMSLNGIVRFYLRSVTPELELYASPINFDPADPVSPVSAPESAAAELAEAIGQYYTQGMAEDVNGLKKELLDDSEFLRQAMIVYAERGRMLDFALRRYMSNEDGGLLFFYYSTIDLCCHMMWRHGDPAHPFFDPSIAGQSSAWFSGRDGSTLKDVIHDLYIKMDPALGKIRAAVGDETPIIVMSDHGFAPYHRKFSLNRWLYDNGYLVLREGQGPELSPSDPAFRRAYIFAPGLVDWSKSRAYGVGFNGLYLNLRGREAEGSVEPADAAALVAELRQKLEALRDVDGTTVVLRAVPAAEAFHGERVGEAPDLVVGYNAGYGNSDESSEGRVPSYVLADNKGGTFNGSHLMDPSVVAGTILTNERLAVPDPALVDLTVEILARYGIEPDESMEGRRILQRR